MSTRKQLKSYRRAVIIMALMSAVLGVMLAQESTLKHAWQKAAQANGKVLDSMIKRHNKFARKYHFQKKKGDFEI